MAAYDLPLDQLRTWRPEVAEPEDLDAFWEDTLAGARAHDLALRLEPVDAGLGPGSPLEVLDVTFAGFGGSPVRGWLTRPRAAEGPLPGVLTCLGYGGGRGLPHEHLTWAAAGFAELVLDTRGQGSRWGSGGDTPDPVGSGPALPGYMTRGLADPADHYYRRLFTDAARALEALRAVPGVDAARTAVTGRSQGGGMALAVAGLVPDVAAVMPDVPFLCHYRRALDLVDAEPYGELVGWLAVHRDQVDAAFRTLSYVDAVNLARRAGAPARFSVALRDPVCPPSTVFAAVNHYGSRAGRPVAAPVVDVWPFNEHEGGGEHQVVRQLVWLRELLGA